ncbi:MAG: phosphatase PAP2 family protein [Prevotella sp.]|nr:phosphatase PAP2 family protein [Prevotella sp.]
MKLLNLTKSLVRIDRESYRGTCLFEVVMLLYLAATCVFIGYDPISFVNPESMLHGRMWCMVTTFIGMALYYVCPCRIVMMLRVVNQLLWLGWWYPDTFELNRELFNFDHLVARWDFATFGCQPSIVWPARFSHPIVSELMAMSYVSYYPLIVLTMGYFFFVKPLRIRQAAFIILGSFFVFYGIFVAFPVAGPQFYFEAIGVDQASSGFTQQMGSYFSHHQESLPIPGWSDGLFHKLLIAAHNAGERPTAAFPSSHMGITTVLVWLARQERCRWLFFTVLSLGTLMFFATVYIQAHYLWDAIAGIAVGTLLYFVLRRIYEAVLRPIQF